MEDWVEGLHQDGIRKLLRFRTVQNPIARAHTREKAHERNMHPDVISQTNKINEGNKHILAESKTDLVGTLQKRQRNFGRYEAMK
jgi:predicted RNA-binding protein with PUA domain